VIASNTGSIPEITGNSALLINDIKNTSKLIDAIKLIISDNNYRDNLITKGFLNVKRFSWDKCAKETLKVYNKVLSN
jgi:glycosyltransferase involved in cell wall biosynthesis